MSYKAVWPFSRPSSVVHRQLIALILLFLPLTACGRYKAQEELSRTQSFAELLKRQDRRWIGNDSFFEDSLLAGRSPEVSSWCAIALGRIESSRALPLLYRALHSSDSAVRAAAAFAIGEIEDRKLLEERYLVSDPRASAELRSLLDDSSLSVRMRAVEALGKIGSREEAIEIVHRLERFSSQGSPYDRVYFGYSISALAQLNDPVAVPILERFADSDDLEVRWRALDALTHLQSKTSGPIFERNLQNSNPEVQSYAACGMGVVADAGKADLLFPLLLPRQGKAGDSIPLSVRMCALKSLGMMGNSASASAITAAISAEPIDNVHPDQQSFVAQAAAVLGRIGASGSEAVLLPLLKFPNLIADNAAIALAKILRENPERFFQLVKRYRFDGQISGSAWAQAMAELGGPDAVQELSQMLERAATSASASERQTLPDILSALAKIDGPRSQEIWRLLLRSRDCAALPAAIAAFRPLPGTKSPWAPIVEAFQACNSSSTLRASIEILSCLKPWIREKEVQQLLWTGLKDRERNVRLLSGTLLRRAGVTGIPEDPEPGSGAITDAISLALAITRKNSTIAQLETSRGPIEIELFREDAPLTVHSFVTLAKQRVYDGMELARMLPFQIEGRISQTRLIVGRTINSEINMRPFERGSIGLALAGTNSDAGGFFIALAAQPHLDGVHTCFGRVISGMPVADRIGPGDRILRILIKETISFHDYQRY